jgi:hypothetical protein
VSRLQTIAPAICLVGSSVFLAETPEIRFTEARYQLPGQLESSQVAAKEGG